jgi:acyl carrier protein phosphodiesterase
MFVSRKKLKALVDESVAVKQENARLRKEIQRLSDSNLDLWWDNKMLNFRASIKRESAQEPVGRYFYTKQKETKI